MNKKFNILVFGDHILDEYYHGRIHRISPEAPIPIFEAEKVEYSLGGVGNLIENLVGVFGDQALIHIPDINEYIDMDNYNNLSYDFYAGKYYEMITGFDSIRTHNFYKIKNEFFKSYFEDETSIIRKTRFLDIENNYVQVGLRLDNERFFGKLRYIDSEKFKIESVNYDNLILKEWDAVVLSDYCKNTFQDKYFCFNLIRDARKRMIPVFLDSRSKDLHKFSGVTHFKPNHKEYEVWKNENSDLIFPHVLHTMSSYGMHYENMVSGSKIYTQIVDKNIVDPTGAGDTTMAGFIYAVLNKFTDDKLLNFCNRLAYRSCMNRGTYKVNKEDLKFALDND